MCGQKVSKEGMSRDLIALDITNDLEVTCSNNGCPWKNSLLNLKEHLKNCYIDKKKIPPMDELINHNGKYPNLYRNIFIYYTNDSQVLVDLIPNNSERRVFYNNYKEYKIENDRLVYIENSKLIPTLWELLLLLEETFLLKSFRGIIDSELPFILSLYACNSASELISPEENYLCLGAGKTNIIERGYWWKGILDDLNAFRANIRYNQSRDINKFEWDYLSENFFE